MTNSRLIKQFIDLVKIDSETKHEREIADYLTGIFEQLGLTVKEDQANKGTDHVAGNLICELEGKNEEKDAIFFTSHMDTVVPGKGINPILEDGYIKTDGTTILGADDKAGLASMIETIHLIKEKEIKHGKITFLITFGEESGLVGSSKFNITKLDAKYGYALDSDGDVGKITVAAPAQAKLFITVFGKSAHAGLHPEKGISAISIAAKAIAKMKLGRIDEDTTANIGRFEGGRQTNIVCDEVQVVAEARSLSSTKLEKQVEHMCETFKQVAKEMGSSSKIAVKHMYPGYHFSEKDPVIEKAVIAINKIGLKPSLVRSGGGSDANHLSGKGVPTINLAVGYEDIHTVNEKIKIKELEKIPFMLLSIIEEA